MQLKEIQHGDKVKNKISVFESESSKSVTLIHLPALGVRASYYEQFAIALTQSGYDVITVDWRGHGHSSVRASSKTNFGYQRLIDDLEDVMNEADSIFPRNKKMILGHSLGGQIGSLFAARYPKQVEGLIHITSCLVYYKGWTGLDRIKVLVAGRVFHPLSKMVGYFPGHVLSFGGREARQVMGDWSYNALNGEYKLDNSDFDYEQALRQHQTNILSITIKGDWMASYEAAKNLYSKFAKDSRVEHLHVGIEETGIKTLNHFNWTRHSDYFIKTINNWLCKS